MNTIAQTDTGPWYRQPWPWLLMMGPAIVIVAGGITSVYAVRTFDGMVAEDYYKQGTNINSTIHRDQATQKLGYAAELSFSGGEQKVSIIFDAASPGVAELTLTLTPAARPGKDRTLVLTRAASGRYQAALPVLAPELWRLNLEDGSRQWRLTGLWHSGDTGARLGAARS